MFCKNCGTKNEATDNFCKNCGTPLENTQKKEESQFEKVAKKKSNPIFIIIGIIIVVAILYIGRQVPQQLIIPETENVTFSGYSFTIPSPYQAVINGDTLTVVSENFQDQEAIGIKIYSNGYEELISEMQALADTGDSLSNLETEKYGNEEYVIAEYDTGDYKGALALKKAEDENVLWIQTVSSSTTRGRKILTEFIPIITTAKKTGTTTSDTDKEISMSVMNTLTGLLDK